MSKRVRLISILVILFISFFLRFFKLSSNPVSLSLDEIMIGYDSYSILKTAHDQHGEFMPLAFRSNNDFKAPVLIYIMAPSIALFGLNEFSVRLPVALFGSLTCILVYFLSKELLFRSKISSRSKELISLFSSLSLAISPWHIQFSRATFEAVLALFFLVLAVVLFLYSLRKKSKFLWVSALFFSLSAYTYHAERIMSPLMVLGLFLIFKKDLFALKKKLLGFLIAGFVFSIPLLVIMLGPQGRARATDVFLSHDSDISSDLLLSGSKGKLETLFTSKPLVLANFWAKRYLDYFDFGHFFLNGLKLTIKGDSDVGIFYLFESVLFFIGIWQLFFSKKKILEKSEKNLFLLWFLIGPLPASLANNAQDPLRSLGWMPVLVFLVGIGSCFLIEKIIKLRFFQKVVVSGLMVVIVVFSLLYYMDIYYSHFPVAYSEFWQYGMKETSQFAFSQLENYDEIIVDPRFGSEGPSIVGLPYAYYLFYGKVDPEVFQNSPRRKVKTGDSVDFSKFTFRDIYWPKDRKSENELFIGSPWVLPPEDLKEDQILKRFYFKNGRLGFLAVESREN